MNLDTRSGTSFREQARAWLTLVPRSGGTPQVYESNGRRIVVTDHVHCPDGFSLKETLLVRGDFQSGVDCRFEGPVFVGGNCLLGKRTRMNSLCTEGGLLAGLGSRIDEWADVLGLIDLRAGAWIGEATSEKGIQLSTDAGAGAMFAPAIASPGGARALSETPAQRSLIEIPLPCSGQMPEFGAIRGFRKDSLTSLGAETWVYDGSLTLPEPVYLKSKLVVRGSFTCPPGSLLDDDVKSGGTIRIGAGSVVRGRIVSRGEMTLEEDCLFEGALEAGLSLRLASGVRGFRAGSPVNASAREKLILEPNVVVRGRLSAGAGVLAGEPRVEGGLELLLAEA